MTSWFRRQGRKKETQAEAVPEGIGVYDSLTVTIKEWTSETHGWFSVRQLDRELSIVTDKAKNNRSQVLHRLVDTGVLERHPTRRGVYRLVSDTERGIDEERELLKTEGLVEEETREVAPLPVDPQIGLHKHLQDQLEEIGKILAKYAKKEHSEAPYRYDVVWKEVEWLPRITHAFEVQDKGNLIEALAKLKHCHDSWGAHLFLVVTGEKDRGKLDQILEPHFRGTFHEIASLTTVLSAEDVGELYQTLCRFEALMKRFMAK